MICPICQQNHCDAWMKVSDRFHGRDELYTLLKCQSCSLVWLADPPAPEKMSQHYGEDYDRAISSVGESDGNRWQGIVGTVGRYFKKGSILDLGCSSGSLLSCLPRGWQLYGVEISPEVAERARRRCGAHVFAGPVLEADFQHHSFDVVTCIHVLEHLEDPVKVLQRVSDWLKPGGIFYAIVPNIDSAAARIFRSYWFALEVPRHLFHFSPSSLRALAAKAGLEVAELKTERETFLEYSSRYVLDSMLSSAGIRRTPLAKVTSHSFPFRAVRKTFRLTALPVLDFLVGLNGEKELIQIILRKPPLA